MSLTRFIFASDIHGNLQDRAANNVLFSFLKEWKPEVRVCGGDLWNFGPLRKGASDDEKRESLADDFAAGNAWFDRFRPTHFLRGNHDERLWDLAYKGVGIARDFAAKGIEDAEEMARKAGCQMFPYHKSKGVISFGKLNMLHGFASGVYAAKATAQFYDNCIFGHIHAIETASVGSYGGARVARSVGCLCALDQDYSSRQPSTLRQQHGFCYGFLCPKTGNYHIFQAAQLGGKWILPSEFTAL